MKKKIYYLKSIIAISLVKKLLNYIEENIPDLSDDYVYYQYPIMRELDEKVQYPSLLLVSSSYGVIFI